MRKDYEQLFSRLAIPEPSAGLFDRVLTRIRVAQELRTVKRRLVLFSFACAGSLALAMPLFTLMRNGIVQSGFADFLSLAFSDAGIVATYWRQFGFMLLESLPAVSIAAFLATVFLFFSSLRFLTRDIKILLTPHAYGSH